MAGDAGEWVGVMDRRGFLWSILALGAAPAIVRADSLMRIIVPSQEIVLPLTFAEIVQKTLKEKIAQLEADIIMHNSILYKIHKTGLYTPPSIKT